MRKGKKNLDTTTSADEAEQQLTPEVYLGWLQCTQCGHGHEVHRAEVEAGDYTDRQACPACCIGPCRITWDINEN